MRRRLAVWLVAALAAACGTGEEGTMLAIESPAFGHQEPMPKKYTGDGEDVSPPLVFRGVPEGTVELALLCDDPDAPTPEPWVHWVAWGIAPDAGGLPEGASGTGKGLVEGRNSWARDNLGYRGPLPPSGTHRYFFRLYALDASLDLAPGATKKELLAAIEGHVLAEAELVGLYTRD